MSNRSDAAATVALATLVTPADATNGKGLIFRTASSTSAVAPAVDIPANLRGRYWRVLTVGANAQFGFVALGDTTPTIVYNQAVVMGTGHLAGAPTLIDSIPEHIWCPVEARRYTFISSNATAGGFIEACVSGEKTG